MRAAVTRAELRRELKRFATKEDLKRFATKEDLKRFATKEDLKRDFELWAGALEHRFTRAIAESENRLRRDLTTELTATLTASLGSEIARHIGALEETFRGWITALDDKYADLPGRMTRLEHVVETALVGKAR